MFINTATANRVFKQTQTYKEENGTEIVLMVILSERNILLTLN